MSGGARCPRCRRATPAAAAFCPGCGAALGSDLVVEVGGPAGRVPVPSGPEAGGGRRARRVGLGVAAALAVAIGASVVSGGGDGRSATTTSTTSDGVGTTSTVAAAPTTTAADEPVTTTTLLPVSGPTGAPLLGEPTGLRVLVATNRGIQRLDLDAGTLTEVETPGRTYFADDLLAMRGGLAVLSEGELRFLPLDGPYEDRRSLSGQLLSVDAAGRALALVYTDGGAYAAVVDRAGAEPRRLDATLSTSVYPPAFGAGTGDLLLPVPGGVFAWRDGVSRPVSAGAVVDAAGPFVLMRRCWPAPVCRLDVVDVATGGVRGSVDDDDPVANLRLAPDGAHLVRGIPFDPARVGGRDPRLSVVRLSDGQVTTLSVDTSEAWNSNLGLDPSLRGALAWSADGRWLFVVRTPSVLSAWRDGLAAPIDLTIPSVELRGPVAVEVDG